MEERKTAWITGASSGLGLSIARDTARLHRGDIIVQAGTGGKGTRFEARFPALAGEEGTE